MLRPRPLREGLEEPCVAPATAGVEVGRGGTERDKTDVHVQPVPRTNDVAQEPSVLVDSIRRTLCRQPNSRIDRKKPLGHGRCLRAVALRTEVDLWRVDLDQADALPVTEHDRVAVRDVVGAVGAPTSVTLAVSAAGAIRASVASARSPRASIDSGDEPHPSSARFLPLTRSTRRKTLPAVSARATLQMPKTCTFPLSARLPATHRPLVFLTHNSNF